MNQSSTTRETKQTETVQNKQSKQRESIPGVQLAYLVCGRCTRGRAGRIPAVFPASGGLKEAQAEREPEKGSTETLARSLYLERARTLDMCNVVTSNTECVRTHGA